ncbi:hypothetical protein [Microbacterium sp. SLBN-146]|uniref:hypothetical protein n=1 Tax=Microbacterium sp. SLBN-146 TaxID=2768457 RepID=UPI00115143CC|nr:hypothetical protein [Microbacterium sp. SLBN-146]TQJ32645.1 hypothetical protein FBY39_3159 [Microbacterium sp. SLBN-146]
MGDVMGWATIVIVLAVPIVFAGVGLSTRFRQRSGDQSAPSSGGLMGIDELFHPSAHNARLVWDAEQVIPIPSPTPDKGPGVIEPGNRIVIDVPSR